MTIKQRERLANFLTTTDKVVHLEHVKQIGQKNMYIVEQNKLYSYLTLVGIRLDDIWYLTTFKYSPTTSKQLTQFSSIVIAGGEQIKRVEQKILDTIVSKLD